MLYKELELSVPVATSNEDISVLVDSVNVERLSNNPMLLGTNDLYDIYNSFIKIFK